jgi:hypothetical protein
MKWHLALTHVAGTALLGSICAAAQQAVPSYVLSLEGKRLTQQKIGDCGTAPLNWSGTAFSYTQKGLEVKGSNKHGAEWKTVVPATTAGKCEVWTASLMHRPGLLIWNANVLGEYDSELFALSFDQDSNPIPWMVHRKFSSDEHGIAQVIAGPDGSPSIIAATKIEDKHDGEAVVYQKYDFLDDRVSKVHGAQGGTAWPISTGATRLLRGTEKKDTESIVLGNATHLGTIVNMLPEEGDEEQRIVFSVGETLKIPRIIVFDATNGNRQIFFTQDVPEAIGMLKSSGAAVSASGESCEEDDCHPFIFWAKAGASM